MRDVDISPDGSYFVVGTTGAYRAGSLCDAAPRWDLGAGGSGQQPTWVDYTGVLGADAFVASGAGDGRNWSTVSGMTMASGRLVYATITGTLATVDFSGGLPTGSATVLSGPAVDGRSWQSRGFLSSECHRVRPAPRWVWAGPVPVSCAPSAPVAQGTEQLSPKQQVAGSSPARGTRNRSSEAIPSLLCLLCGHSVVILLQ